MRFAIDAKPVPPRRFVLPAHERSTAPAPLPELGEPVTPPEWGAGAAKQTPRRVLKAQTPEEAQRTPKPRTTTHQAFETFAPDMDTEPLARVTLAVASEEPMPGLFGDMIFHCSPEAHNMRRLSLGTMSLLRQHSDDDPVGRVLSLQHVQDRTGAWSHLWSGGNRGYTAREGDVSGAPNRGAARRLPGVLNPGNRLRRRFRHADQTVRDIRVQLSHRPAILRRQSVEYGGKHEHNEREGSQRRQHV